MSKVRQIGENKSFPMTGEIWKVGEAVPEWLSDKARVIEIGDNGDPVLATIMTTSGDTEFYDTTGRTVLATIKGPGGVLIYSEGWGIRGLSAEQLRLLYGRID